MVVHKAIIENNIQYTLRNRNRNLQTFKAPLRLIRGVV